MKKLSKSLWVKNENDVYTVGLTPELQDDIGTVGFVEYTRSTKLAKDDVIVRIEASKTVLDINTPLAGEVLGFNQAAESNPKILNSAKDEECWVVKLTNVNEEEFNKLPDYK